MDKGFSQNLDKNIASDEMYLNHGEPARHGRAPQGRHVVADPLLEHLSVRNKIRLNPRNLAENMMVTS